MTNPVSKPAAIAGAISLVMAVVTLWSGGENPPILTMGYAISAIPIARAIRAYARAGNILITVHLTVVSLFSAFALLILDMIDRVRLEPAFDFSVFSEETLTAALGFNTLSLGLSLIAYSRFPRLAEPSSLLSGRYSGAINHARVLAANQRLDALLAFSWFVIAAVAWITPNVFQFPYPTNSGLPLDLPHTIRVFVVLIPLAVLVLASFEAGNKMSLHSAIARGTFYVAVFAVGILHGPRGAMTGLLIAVAAIDLTFSRASWAVRASVLLLDVLYLMFLVVQWPEIRVMAAEVGFWQAFISSFQHYSGVLDLRSGVEEGIFLNDIPMMGQSLFHFLYVVTLIDWGVSRNYQSFIDLVPQQLPEILDGVLWTRPIGDNWLINDYFLNGGGFYVYAAAYWNGGLVAMSLFAVGLAWCLARIEVLFKDKGRIFAIAYFAFAILLPVNIYYGIQGLVRGLEFGLIAYLIVKAWNGYIPRAQSA